MPHRPTNIRDAALRRLSTANRWLVAGSVALTGVFAEVAAQAFPGKTVKTSVAKPGNGQSAKKVKTSSSAPKALRPPAAAPRASTTPEPTTSSPEASQSQEVAPESSQEPAQTREAAPETPTQEAAPTQESAPVKEESAPTKEETAPVKEESAAPVVSGGS